MNRDEWKFTYTADKLLEAASAKIAFHSGRFDWWSAKQKEVEDKIRSEGIEIDESVAASVSNYASNSYARGPQVNIRNDLVRDLQECVGKVAEHRGKIRDYDAWSQVLASQGSTSFDLHQDDWLFFFGK